MNDLSLINISRLHSHMMKQLISIIGLPKTTALLAVRGGRPMYVPVTPDRSTELSKIIGRDAVAALASSELCGRIIELPKADKILIQLRDIAINNEPDDVTNTALATKYNLSRRWIISIKNAKKEPDPTIDMFGDDSST